MRLMGKVFLLLIGFFVCVVSVGFAASSADQTDVQAFVMEEYEHGVSCGEAKAFSGDHVPQLVSMLEDSDYEPYWTNIIVTLGCMGDPSAVEPLENFLQRHKKEISFDTFSALLSVPTALGFISFDGDQRAAQLLSELVEDDYWEKANIQVLGELVVQDIVIKKNLKESARLAWEYSQDN